MELYGPFTRPLPVPPRHGVSLIKHTISRLWIWSCYAQPTAGTHATGVYSGLEKPLHPWCRMENPLLNRGIIQFPVLCTLWFTLCDTLETNKTAQRNGDTRKRSGRRSGMVGRKDSFSRALSTWRERACHCDEAPRRFRSTVLRFPLHPSAPTLPISYPYIGNQLPFPSPLHSSFDQLRADFSFVDTLLVEHGGGRVRW